MAEGQQKQKRTFRTFTYRGVELDQLLDLALPDVVALFEARKRRKFSRGIGHKANVLIKKLRKSKKEAAFGEKPKVVNTHLRNMVVMPEMIGSIVGVYQGKIFFPVEIKPEMVGHYLGEFALTYKPCRHGKAGLGKGDKGFGYIPLK
uniref:40S ribosomal protein S15 n=1 Tax=Chromera velia CCMP2878 TaxID=1169474 RepID=A0A0G4FEX0_9ALVE|mmetsp:Transcript_44365/g.87642  ORF Transcript_44365/g.87642 Transcript_44365/m.87642 type:complete len:147 (-) Transcript_44365:272-712(-)|eukprot:Cvel_16582.t1-p1 / transcript=Cvel_16582.t1 / gene=Cvel_16582 / organism=Chromera_velia_CCMP2878 / gene_product=40S ribosomal protein S15, putative / transcript_product=40S ribosomal protein S15, putative / location=Cvel_scaffold1283:29458-29895(-) / protein_length=146 / sequence_SO=supercontig / SO=protein_coding / is_pseudo=false